jgi:hypothetical protein
MTGRGWRLGSQVALWTYTLLPIIGDLEFELDQVARAISWQKKWCGRRVEPACFGAPCRVRFDFVSLVLIPKADTADDHNVLDGELQVGQIYKRKAAIRPETKWLWALNGALQGHDGLALTGLAATLDEATAALQDRWTKLISAEDLSEAD